MWKICGWLTSAVGFNHRASFKQHPDPRTKHSSGRQTTPRTIATVYSCRDGRTIEQEMGNKYIRPRPGYQPGSKDRMGEVLRTRFCKQLSSSEQAHKEESNWYSMQVESCLTHTVVVVLNGQFLWQNVHNWFTLLTNDQYTYINSQYTYIFKEFSVWSKSDLSFQHH